jgi:hypothetical protein
VFDGTNYQVWAIGMETYLDANDLWEVVEQEYEITPLPNNLTLAQIKNRYERKQRKSKARASLFAAIPSSILPESWLWKTTKAICDFLKNEYDGDERVKRIQVLNLISEFKT